MTSHEGTPQEERPSLVNRFQELFAGPGQVARKEYVPLNEEGEPLSLEERIEEARTLLARDFAPIKEGDADIVELLCGTSLVQALLLSGKRVRPSDYGRMLLCLDQNRQGEIVEDATSRLFAHGVLQNITEHKIQGGEKGDKGFALLGAFERLAGQSRLFEDEYVGGKEFEQARAEIASTAFDIVNRARASEGLPPMPLALEWVHLTGGSFLFSKRTAHGKKKMVDGSASLFEGQIHVAAGRERGPRDIFESVLHEAHHLGGAYSVRYFPRPLSGKPAILQTIGIAPCFSDPETKEERTPLLWLEEAITETLTCETGIDSYPPSVRAHLAEYSSRQQKVIGRLPEDVRDAINPIFLESEKYSFERLSMQTFCRCADRVLGLPEGVTWMALRSAHFTGDTTDMRNVLTHAFPHADIEAFFRSETPEEGMRMLGLSDEWDAEQKKQEAILAQVEEFLAQSAS